MTDFDDGRGRRRLLTAAVVLAVALVAAFAGAWFSRSSAATASANPVASVVVSEVASPPPPWPATLTSVAATDAPAGTVDGGWGWQLPVPGAAGPFSVTDQGVPFGYRQDEDGAGLAAVNAVIAGKYLVPTFADPWAALGFLADPRYAEQGGNQDLEEFFSGPVIPRAIGAPTTTTTAAAAAAGPGGGGRVLGVQVTPVSEPAADMRVVVLWEDFNSEYRIDGQQGFTVRIQPVSVLLAWIEGDWKVTRVGAAPDGIQSMVLGVVPPGFPVPAEHWHR